jgi:hypothetical protein
MTINGRGEQAVFQLVLFSIGAALKARNSRRAIRQLTAAQAAILKRGKQLFSVPLSLFPASAGILL